MGFRLVKTVCFFIFLIIAHHSFSQERQLGTWKMFLPYGSSIAICDAGDKVYSAASQSIFSYEKSTGVIQTYDKSSGLSEIGIKTMNYDPATKMLAIAYLNSNLDFIYNGTDVYNIPDIKNQAISGAISIYDISFYNGKAYVSSDLGISVIDLNLMQINYTYVIGSSGQQISVYCSSSDGVNLYAATSEGVKYAPLTSANLQDFNSWTLFGPSQNLPQRQSTYVRAINHKVYAVVPTATQYSRDTLYGYNGSTWLPIYYTSPDTITSMNVVNGSLYFTVWDTINNYHGWQGKIDSAGNLTVSYTNNYGYGRPLRWFESSGTIWASDYYNGLYKIDEQSGNTQNIVPDGPRSQNVFALNYANQLMSVAPGGVNDSWGIDNNNDGFFVYDGSHWHNTPSAGSISGWHDILCTVGIPQRGKTYFGSYGNGLIEYDNASQTITNTYSSGSYLEDVYPGTTLVSALASDYLGNLWIGNANVNNPIKELDADGHTWREFQVPGYSGLILKKMLIDQNNQLWAPLRSSTQGLLVWSYNGTIDNTSDDLSVVLNTGVGTGGMPSTVVYGLAEDLSGNIWIGTDAGIGVFYCPGNIFQQGGCDATRIKVTLNGYVGYLFGMQSVRALAVDAANRVWVGTTEGLWLISNDGQTQYLNFTTDNSPLPNNQITDIAINHETGEVFIGTIGGLVSYQGDAVDTCVGCKQALVYPNPVKPDYAGPIAIKGLTDNAYVKITDVSGTLVFQGRANGTQMVWDGKGYNGVRAKSGIYLVFSSNDLGKSRRVAKILLTD